MDNKIPWVITMGQKTLIPYYKYIVKDSPKTIFSIYHQSHHILSLPLFPLFSTPFPVVYVEFIPYPFGSIPPIWQPVVEVIAEPNNGAAEPLLRMTMVAHFQKGVFFFISCIN